MRLVLVGIFWVTGLLEDLAGDFLAPAFGRQALSFAPHCKRPPLRHPCAATPTAATRRLLKKSDIDTRHLKTWMMAGLVRRLLPGRRVDVTGSVRLFGLRTLVDRKVWRVQRKEAHRSQGKNCSEENRPTLQFFSQAGSASQAESSVR